MSKLLKRKHSFAVTLQVRWACVILFLALTLWSCSQKPNSTGIGILPPDDVIAPDSTVVTASEATTFLDTLYTGHANVLLVGTFQNGESIGLLSFDGVPDTLKDASVTSATLVLSPRYSFGNSLTPFTMNIYEIAQAWKADSVTWASITPGFYQSNPVGSFDGNVPDTGTVSISLDPSLLQKWFQRKADSLPIYGLALVAPQGKNVVKGFGTFQSSSPPALEVIYIKDGSQDTIRLSSGANAYVAHPISPISPSNEFVVQGGTGLRGFLLFDVHSIPSHSFINDAQLVLSLDPNETQLNSYSVDSVIAYFVTDSTNRTVSEVSYRFSSPRALTQTTVEIPIAPIVQRWVSGEPNQGIILRAAAENSRLDRFAFYSVTADSLLQPRLFIKYTSIK
ncbi:MAG: DNRLRE domain-containing protein [Bacteroidota bacterium]